jgi:hypothetical protein
VIEVRTITKPVAGTVKVYLDDVEQLSGGSVDTTTGLVTFSVPPAVGVEITADFAFDVPVRFDTDHMAVTIESFKLHPLAADPDRRAQGLRVQEALQTPRGSPMDDERWSLGARAVFVLVASLALWALILFAIRLIFG